jgi:geranylgeranyl diphosphate synthase type II
MTDYIKIFENFLKKEIDYDNPKNLYEPVKYLLDSGGKRLRPLITLFVSGPFHRKHNKCTFCICCP